MSKTLTEYEERAVMEIALWKAETPSRVTRAFQVIHKPLNEVTGRVAPAEIRCQFIILARRNPVSVHHSRPGADFPGVSVHHSCPKR